MNIKTSYESASFHPVGVAYNVKANQPTLFNAISVAESAIIKNRIGNSDIITFYLNTASVNPIVLGAGEYIEINIPISNIYITSGAGFGGTDQVDIIIGK